MAADFEPVAEALLARVADLADVTYSSRIRVGLETLPDQPAVIVGMAGATAQAAHGLPTRWTATFRVGYLARSDGGEESPESRLNAFLVEMQDAMLPGDGETVNTLDGTCEHAWIAGEVDYTPPTREDPWMECWVSVEVLVIA